MATIPIIQLLRNNNIYSSRDAARSALEGQKNNVPDGGVILARYSGTTGEQMIIKTLAGFVSNISTSENATVTIIDVEGADKNVQDAITSAINKLNKADTAVYGQYVSSVSEANGIITVTRTHLPSLDRVAFKGEAITAITQTNGRVYAEFGGIDAYKVSLTDVHGRFESENVGGALYEIQDSLSEAMGSVGAQIGALSTSSKVTLENADGTEGILKVYTIKQGGTTVGTIDIPKDLVVKSGSVVKGNWNDGGFTENVSGSGTALKLVIANQEAPVYINTLDLVKDHTGGNGISISDTNVISVQIAEGSENFLTVGENGVKLSGVQTAIDAAAASAKTKVEKTDGGSHVTLTSTTSTTDSSVTYTISESDIASARALTDEVNDRQSADTTLQNNIDNINSTIESYGQVTSQALNDLGTRLDDYGKVTSQSLNDLSTKFGDYYTKTEVDTAIANVDVTEQLQNYYTKTEVDSKDATLQTAINALDAHVNENEDIVSKSLNDLNNRIGNTYVKSYIDALEARIAELETKFLNMENNGLQAGEY